MLLNSAKFRSGIEGPKHDPYGVSFITFKKTDKLVYDFKDGSLSGTTLHVNGILICQSPVGDDETAMIFSSLIGVPFENLEQYEYRAGIAKYCQKYGKKRCEAYNDFSAFQDAESKIYM